MVIAELKNASKEYQMGDQTITALQATNFKVNDGELLLIIGPSGSGKTTLLSLIGCVIYPSKGELSVNNENVNAMSQSQMAKLRLNTIGFVFQNFNLIAPLNAFDNVILPLQLQGVGNKEANQRTEDALKKVGMFDRKKNLPKQLSGGQQQRIAIARALVTNPKIILCDEPTASLDKDSVSVVMNELKSLAENGKAVVVVTHDPRLKEYAHRIVEVKNGIVTELKDLSQNL
ncbi:ABC transporter ATP-binding protein [uncultured Cytophaga sp.]|uniref:ABC transporter ATP-binding protein n=1 Tax=uncultured Cytophaga sp. TaxID=160238 RepID=UPI00261D0521|nr:ABC transporter ATP-binding protein [uncultured Cytophaga sp.]